MAKKKKEGSRLTWEQLFAKYSQPAQVKSSTFSLSVGGEKVAQKKSTTPTLKKKEEGYGFSFKTQATPSSPFGTEGKKEKEVIKLEPTKKPEEQPTLLELTKKEPEKKEETFVCSICHNRFPSKPGITRFYWKGKYVCKACFDSLKIMARNERLAETYYGKKPEEDKGKELEKEEDKGKEGKKKPKIADIIGGLTEGLKEKRCQWCKKPIPRGAKVCPYCGKEQTIGGGQEIRGVATGGIVSGILYALSYFKLLPIPLDFYFLGGIFVSCILLSFKSNAAKAIGALVLMSIIGFYAMSIPMVQALIPMKQINDVLYELNIKKDYAQCLITHLTDVENIMSYGGLDALCKRILTEVKAVKEGCTECLTLKISTEVPLVTPGSSFLFRLEYSMSNGADLPAQNITTNFYIDNETKTKNVMRCSESNSCTLYPGDFEESSVKLDATETSNFCDKNKDYFKYTASTKYEYVSRGYTHFYITNNLRIYERRTAITSSGPLDIIVSSDSSYYRKDEDSSIILVFAFVNKGEGVIKLNDLKIVELIPDGIKCNGECNLLFNGGCDLTLQQFHSSRDEKIWNVNLDEFPFNISIKPGKKIMFACTKKIDENNKFFQSLSGPFVTYTYEAIANYTYFKNQTGQVWIDKDYCGYEKIPSSKYPSEAEYLPSNRDSWTESLTGWERAQLTSSNYPQAPGKYAITSSDIPFLTFKDVLGQNLNLTLYDKLHFWYNLKSGLSDRVTIEMFGRKPGDYTGGFLECSKSISKNLWTEIIFDLKSCNYQPKFDWENVEWIQFGEADQTIIVDDLYFCRNC